MEICDGCGTHIQSGETRYIVHMTITADDAQTVSPVTDEEMEEIIARFESANSIDLEQQVYSERSFILCARCKQRFMQNPLGKGSRDPFEEDGLSGPLH